MGFMQRARRATAGVWAAAAICFAACPAISGEPTAREFLSAARLRTQLDRPTDVVWTGTRLRDAVYRLAAANNMAVVMDRRVDPDRPLNLTLSQTPLCEVWRHIADDNGIGISWFGPVMYLGPTSAATNLQAIAALRLEELQTAPADLRRLFAMTRPLAWADIAEPRQIVAQLAGEAKLRVANPEFVPHDLWFHCELPPLPLIDRLSLVLVEFDATFRIDAAARTITLVPIPETVTPAQTAGKSPQAAPAVRPATSTPQTPGKKVYTLKAKDLTLAQLIAALKAKGLKIRVDDTALAAAKLSLDRPTTVDVQNVSLVELLEQAAEPLGLTAREVGDAVEIAPR